jgi:uncharacterized protein YraI
MNREELMVLKKTILALATLALSGGVAAAAVATTDLNMRAGPGTDYQVVGVIPDGASVRVRGCQGSWCEVDFRGRSGFASASYLSGGETAVTIQPGYAYRSYGPAYRSYAYTPGYYGSYGYPDDYAYGYRRGPSIGFGLSLGRGYW